MVGARGSSKPLAMFPMGVCTGRFGDRAPMGVFAGEMFFRLTALPHHDDGVYVCGFTGLQPCSIEFFSTGLVLPAWAFVGRQTFCPYSIGVFSNRGLSSSLRPSHVVGVCAG